VTEAEFRALKPGDIVGYSNYECEVLRTFKNQYNEDAYKVRYLRDEMGKGYEGNAVVPDNWRLIRKAQTEGRLSPVAGYDSLAAVLDEALAQAQAGKGKERHANGEPYDAQKIVTLNLQIGSEHGAIFQGCKKAQESARLEAERGDAELLGAINYLAAAVIIRRKLRAKAGGK
jgi:hypothetical protein